MTHRHYNLPSEQRETQRLVEQWNTEEVLWRRLAQLAPEAPTTLPPKSEPQLRELDLREHADERPPDDCIGRRLKPET